MPIDLDKFLHPGEKYRVIQINHYWPPENRKLVMRAIKDYGFGGVVTNVPSENGFTFNPDNLADFKSITDELDDAGLSYWIYDEHNYPSGIGDGKTLEGHPELEAKGFYARRFATYNKPRRVDFQLDADSDKIVWAAKYPRGLMTIHGRHLITERMEAVPFAAGSVTCELGVNEVLFVFCVKPAYEGSQMVTDDIYKLGRYINIMDPRAVRLFIDKCYEPVERAAPGVYRKAAGVFTDEPSLMAYSNDYEVWPYALAPWVDGLFEEFENEYGFPLLPQLPFLFEGRLQDSYAIRVKFQRLVGKLITRAYSAQLSEWCKARGGSFSGHYLCEEWMTGHVRFYGDLLEIVKGADYPGIDVLVCLPEKIGCNTMKFIQTVSRKKGTNGMMVELNPWIDIDEFEKNALDNITGTVNLLYHNGVRVVHSYCSPEYGEHDESLKGYIGYNPPSDYAAIPSLAKAHRTFIGRAETIWFNEYVGRLGYMLEDAPNYTNTFFYYGLEDVQAKTRPACSCGFFTESPEGEADIDTIRLTAAIYEAGHDFYFADRDDLAAAEQSLTASGKPMISGCEVKTVIVPAMDVIYGESLRALAALSGAGVEVLFHSKLPTYCVEAGSGAEAVSGAEASDNTAESDNTDEIDCTAKSDSISAYTGKYVPCEAGHILERLGSKESDFTASAYRVDIGNTGGVNHVDIGNTGGAKRADGADDAGGGVPLMITRYCKGGQEMYFVSNNTRSAVEARFGHAHKKSAILYNPADGSAAPFLMGEAYTLPSFRGVFVVFE